MSQAKARRFLFAGLISLALVFGIGGASLAAPVPEPSVEAGAGPLVGIDSEEMVTIETAAGPLVTAKANVLRKTIDLTKGRPKSVPPAGISTDRVYCTAFDKFPGCIVQPEVTWTVIDCQGDVFGLDVVYVNKERRQAPIETTEGDFTDTDLIPAATSAGPGAYLLQFRLVPSQFILVTSNWAPQPRLQIGRFALRNETPFCP